MKKKRPRMVQDKVTAIPNKHGKETKSFATFSAGHWKNNTVTYLKSIEHVIKKPEMSKILLQAKALRTSASQAQKEGALTFETMDDVPNDMIIQNGLGKSESSDEEAQAPTPAQHQHPPLSPAAPGRKETIRKAYQGGAGQPSGHASSSSTSSSTLGKSAGPSWAASGYEGACAEDGEYN